MKINLENNELFIVPEEIDLSFAKYQHNFLSTIINENFNSQAKTSSVFIDLRSAEVITFGGVHWIYQLILDARNIGYNPYLIVLRYLKPFLLKTGIGKIIEIHSSLLFDKRTSESVIDLEKDLLWSSVMEGDK